MTLNLFDKENAKEKTWEDEWVGMPEYINIKPEPPKQIAIFKFKSDEDFDLFMEVVQRELYGGNRVFDGKQKKNEKQAWFPLPPRPSEHIYIAPSPKCYYCGKNATRKSYKDNNGQVDKVLICENCS
jgi:hypothetical protein